MDCRIIISNTMKNKTKIGYALVIALVQVQSIAAQTPGFTDDVQDVPIDNWILPMLLVGAGSVFFYLKKKQTIIK